MSNTASNILDQVLTPFTECLTPEVAQRIIEMRASSETQSRLDELADKANEGQLSALEEAEYPARLVHSDSRNQKLLF